MDRWFEDFPPGTIVKSRGATLSEPQILDFALRWDPQPFHIDRQAAEASPFGGVIASGFHSLALAFRLLIVEMRVGPSSIGSPGIDELRWVKPVRPGDTLRATMTVLEARPSRSKPDRGALLCATEVVNQDGVVVMTWRNTHLMLKRPD
jgi:acyl dehydratase